MLTIILITVSIPIIIFLTIWLVNYSVLKDNYKWYKPTYEAIKSKNYVVTSANWDNAMIIFREKGSTKPNILYDENEIIYFNDTKSIKLLKGYIHTSTIFFDPYSKYWYNKIKEQIEINSSVQNMRDFKLKQLLK